MILADTHTHLYEERFDNDRREVIARAIESGVRYMMIPSVDSASHDDVVALAQEYPDNCFAMMGLHPTYVNDNPDYKNELALLERYLKTPPVRFCAMGETGLDLYWSRDFLKEQEEALRFQLDLALEYDLPVVLHTRDAFEEIINVVSDYAQKGIRGVFHSFAGTRQHYLRMKELGDFKFGIGGVITYKNSAVAEVVCGMELADMVLETDSPYLPPVPYRGKRNESSYVKLVAGKVAEIKCVSLETVAQVTTSNALEVFGIEKTGG